jgi:hypothetical protein
MENLMKEQIEEYTLEYDDSHKTKYKVFDKLIALFKEHETYDGERIRQGDIPEAVILMLLEDIADDIIKFKVNWKE